jgi:pyruvate/2-oxoglutarate dehydrogenase complex dihydrolipoamide dehydrogenase (E3) component
MLRFGSGPFVENGVEVRYPSEARLVDERKVQLDGATVDAGAVLIAAGLEPLIPPVEGLREAGYLDNESVLELRELPRRMAVIGAGPIGAEFAQVFARFGVDVTIVEALDRLLPPEEPESGAALWEAFNREDIAVRTMARVARVERTASGTRALHFADGERLEVDEILVAVGRTLNAERLGLDRVGIEHSGRGIKVDATLRTTAPWAWAAGDVVGGLLFTHTASAMGPIAARNALAGGGSERYEPRIVPRVTFTDPEVASVGMTEREARAAGHEVRIGMALVKDAEKAEIDGQDIGHVKVVADRDGQLLGCSIVCEGAGDMIHEAVAIMAGRTPVGTVAAEMHAYPTMSELMRSALSEAAG